MTTIPNITHASVIEARIVGQLVTDLLADGLTITVWNGGDEPELRDSTDTVAIFANLAASDQDELTVERDGQYAGWIRLVWGNDDAVISDYSVRLEDVMARANRLAERPPSFGSNTTARFWVNLAGGNTALVKLRKDQELTHCEGGQTDEGFDYTARTWRFDGETVHVCWQNNACDCDGPISRSGSSFCALADLQEGYRCPDDLTHPFARNGVILPIIFPKWSEKRFEQRDAYAEAAGY